MRKYKARPGYWLKGDAQEIGETIEALTANNGGRITTKQLLAAAKANRSPLHNEFEWDDSVAATLHRMNQAARLARAVVVYEVDIDEQEAPETRAFICIRDEDDQPGFESIFTVLDDDDKRAQIFQEARDKITSWRRQYKDLQEFAQIFDAIDTLVV